MGKLEDGERKQQSNESALLYGCMAGQIGR